MAEQHPFRVCCAECTRAGRTEPIARAKFHIAVAAEQIAEMRVEVAKAVGRSVLAADRARRAQLWAIAATVLLAVAVVLLVL